MTRQRSRIRRTVWRGALAAAVAAILVTTLTGAPGPTGAVLTPSQDPFYHYTGSTALAKIKLGTVLKTRTLDYHLTGLRLPLAVTQLQFRSSNELGQPDVGVTSIVHAPGHATVTRAVSYQSFYDSLNPADEPSQAIAGGKSLGGVIPDVELPLFAAFLGLGDDIIIPDTEGQTADFSSGPEYGMVTLDSIRAALNSGAAGLTSATKVAMIGYSGGAIATGWASALAPSYAPDLTSRLVGAAEGGILVDPDHNLHYISGSLVWAGVLAMSIVGIARAEHIDLTPYMSAYGQKLNAKLQQSSITTVLGAYPGLTWQKLAKPGYAEPEDIPLFVTAANKLDLGSRGAPTIPMFMGQGAGGVLEGTPGTRHGIGAGDGVMVAGDVRSLARQWCAAGTTVQYQQFNLTSHITTAALWLGPAISWVDARFAGKPAPNDCARIRAGNPLSPIG
ncbi:MAG TPA: lipase family protein [Jatrophihabitantaceae bacterium]